MTDLGENVGIGQFFPLTIRFRPLRQKMSYQFQATPQNTEANTLLRIVHSDKVKIIEEL